MFVCSPSQGMCAQLCCSPRVPPEPGWGTSLLTACVLCPSKDTECPVLPGVETATSPSRSLAGSREVLETLRPQGREWRKKSSNSLIFISEALILLLRFPASFPSQSCPPWLAATDVCGEVTQGCLSCRSSGWGKWSQEGQRHEVLQKPCPGANREPAASHQSVLEHPAPAAPPRAAEHQP